MPGSRRCARGAAAGRNRIGKDLSRRTSPPDVSSPLFSVARRQCNRTRREHECLSYRDKCAADEPLLKLDEAAGIVVRLSISVRRLRATRTRAQVEARAVSVRSSCAAETYVNRQLNAYKDVKERWIPVVYYQGGFRWEFRPPQFDRLIGQLGYVTAPNGRRALPPHQSEAVA